ncbi:MAG: chemotaxis protein, partial [Gemmatimonadota bacterium]|nr:chemotaxis protein [Gemmatimonadota bacterium]
MARDAGNLAVAADGAGLSPAQFDAVRRLMHRTTGIDLVPGKESLVRSRLAPRLRLLGLSDVGSYLDYLDRDASGAELAQMVDLITTNKTSFFREPEHFDVLQRDILPPMAAAGRVPRIWSAGCSSGEEAYTAAIVARETLPTVALPARILATDV